MKTTNYFNIFFLSIICIILTSLKSLANTRTNPIFNLFEYELEESVSFNNDSYLLKNSPNFFSESKFLLSELTTNLEAGTKFNDFPEDTFYNYFDNYIDNNFNKNFENNNQPLAENNLNHASENDDIEALDLNEERKCLVEEHIKTDSAEDNQNNNTYFIKKIEVIENTVLQTEIEEIITPCQNRTLTQKQLNNLALEISKLYLEKGYITSKAKFDEVKSLDGESSEKIATIKVIEGKIEYDDITVESTNKFNNYVHQRIALGATKIPFNATSVEEQLRLLKTNPLFESVTARLKPSGEDGKTKLEIIVEEANPFFGTFGFDNYSPPSIGDVEMVANLGYRGLTGLGDTFFVSYSPKVENFNTYNLDIN